MGKSGGVVKVFGFEPYQTEMLIGMAQNICMERGYTPRETLAACVVCGVTYNGRRDLSILAGPYVEKEQMVNCAPVLDEDFFMETGRMHAFPDYRAKWLKRYRDEIQPQVRRRMLSNTKVGRLRLKLGDLGAGGRNSETG